MNGDLFFRILFLVLFVPGTVIRGYYARKVRATRKRRSMKERLEDTVQAEGKAGAILLLVQGIYLIITVTLYLLFSHDFMHMRAKRGTLPGTSPCFSARKRKAPKNRAHLVLGLVTLKDLPSPSTVLKDMRKYIR